ncbi:glycosyltransferase [Chryseobacterium aahli]|uniref:glycosyltransferase n=1 Tax=Chryseobacterium aahli TaxID=1278643 RepID=UPI001F61318C|nr:glycosyltransferase [Chryseobacterium aahli]MCI3938003.1 glycosyltransferase [Chryseobacterium aahli]
MDLDMQLEDESLVVAVYMITYNQDKYIEKAIESVINQKTNFKFKLFVGEDCSTDNTREICLKLAEKYPEKIHLVIMQRNIGASLNAKNIFHLCFNSFAKYIALIEGDDYWTDPLKLQRQVDFLEQNEDYSICFHNVDEVDEHGEKLDERLVISDHIEKTYSIEDLAEGNFIHTASVLFRRNFNELPSWFFTSPAGDYPLHIMNASYGLIKYFPEKMAAYRIGQGVWSSQTRQVQFVNTIFVIKLMIANLKLSNQVIKNFDNQISRLLLHIKDIVSPLDIPSKSPENAAYNLSFKKLIIILLKKIRYSF